MGHSIGDAIEKEAGMPVNILDVTFISVIRRPIVSSLGALFDRSVGTSNIRVTSETGQ